MFRDHLTFSQVVDHTASIYRDLFNEKLFRQQLAYYLDVNYSEAIDFMEGQEVSNSEIEKFLTDLATSELE